MIYLLRHTQISMRWSAKDYIGESILYTFKVAKQWLTSCLKGRTKFPERDAQSDSVWSRFKEKEEQLPLDIAAVFVIKT